MLHIPEEEKARIVDAWKRIEQALETLSPGLSQWLAPGASEEQIRDAEKRLGRPLPDEQRVMLALHDGEAKRLRVFGHFELLSLDRLERIGTHGSSMAFAEWQRSEGPPFLALITADNEVRYELYDDFESHHPARSFLAYLDLTVVRLSRAELAEDGGVRLHPYDARDDDMRFRSGPQT